jgi:hypothetical protein
VALSEQKIVLFFCVNGIVSRYLGIEFFVQKRILSPVKSIEFVNDRMLYTIQRGHWYGIVLDVHAPAENKHDVQRTAFMRN